MPGWSAWRRRLLAEHGFWSPKFHVELFGGVDDDHVKKGDGAVKDHEVQAVSFTRQRAGGNEPVSGVEDFVAEGMVEQGRVIEQRLEPRRPRMGGSKGNNGGSSVVDTRGLQIEKVPVIGDAARLRDREPGNRFIEGDIAGNSNLLVEEGEHLAETAR